jgi:hypothetical protein
LDHRRRTARTFVTQGKIVMLITKVATRPAHQPNNDDFPAKSADALHASTTHATAWKTYANAWTTYANAWTTYANAWTTYANTWTTYAAAWKTHANAWTTQAVAWTTYTTAWQNYVHSWKNQVPPWTFAAMTCLGMAGATHAQSQLIILEPDGGFTRTLGLDINDAGEVLVLRMRASGSTQQPVEWAAVWENGTWRPLTYPAAVQSVCPQNTEYPAQYTTWTAITAGGINNQGTVAGGFASGCGATFAATWTREGVVRRYRSTTAPGCIVPYSIGYTLLDLSDNGVVAGTTRGCTFGGGVLLTQPSSSILQGVPLTRPPFGTFADINNSGIAVGWSQVGNGDDGAQRWNSPTSVTDLGAGNAFAINDAGVILTSSGVWENGVITPYNPSGTPPSLLLGSARDINDLGSIVGSNAVQIGGQRYNLAALGMVASGYTNLMPVRMNNSHWIVGTMQRTDGTNIERAFLFKIVLPCDDIDFNNNEVFPEDQDVVDYLDVLAGGECAACNDIDFNNNGVFPEDQDVIDFFNVLAGGACP